MIVGMAAPWNVASVGGIDNIPACEVLSPGCFARAVRTGRSLLTGESIYATTNHRSKKRYRLGSIADGRLRLFEREDGLWFELDSPLPRHATGVSVHLRPLKWRKQADLLYRVEEADLLSVSLVLSPREPAYAITAAHLMEK
jgi:hypothetical protein